MRLSACVMASALVVGSVRAGGQERLVGRRSGGAGAALDLVRFADAGVVQFAFAGLDSVRVVRAWQSTVPVAVATPLGDHWRLDVTALYATGGIAYRNAAGGAERRATLSGTSDVRVRATGRLWSDAITVTLGGNVPSGQTSLSGGEYDALRILAAPALALGSTPVGTGPSGTAGVVVSRPAGAWLLAAGASYEHRGRYQPVAALAAGAPSADFRPGGVVRTSLAAERSLGPHRLNVGVSGDMFANDRLRGVPEGAANGTPTSTLATVRLGPVLTADVQLQVASSRFRDVAVYSAWLWRAAYARDGITAAGSSGRYLEGGLRGALPLQTRTELVMATGARWHAGLGFDQGLTTSGVRSLEATIGIRRRQGLLSLQPYIRGQAGTLRSRAGGGGGSNGFAGLTTGIVLQGRF